MPEALVANAPPLIFLSHVDGIDWLARFSSEPVTVPEAVIAEIEAGFEGPKLATKLRDNPKFDIVSDLAISAVIAAWDLGAGESQVIARCDAQSGSRAVLDDKAARDCARSLGFPIIGTLGVVLVAKRRGWIKAARPVIDELLAHKLFLAPDLVRVALAEVGE